MDFIKKFLFLILNFSNFSAFAGDYSSSIGNAAANFYLADNEKKTSSQLTIDWSYNAMYFKYQGTPWITISFDNLEEVNNITTGSEDLKYLLRKAFSELNSSSYQKVKQSSEKIFSCIELMH